MPHKGLFSQGVAILLEGPVSIDAIKRCVTDYEIAGEQKASEEWSMHGEGLFVSYLPQDNGYAAIDIVNRRWPDDMGDPKANPTLFGSWATGHFGPFAFPGGLKRSAQQSWHWRDAKKVYEGHKAFIRIRLSYGFGIKDPNTPVFPENYQPIKEMLFLTRLARKLLTLPGAIAYYNPNGEVLDNREHIGELIKRYDDSKLLPLELWSNIRLFTIEEKSPWTVMDTVGMEQLDVPDHEAVFDPDRYDPNEVACFLRNISHYVLQHGKIIKDHNTTDGPGALHWFALNREEGLVQPPRRVIRWFPKDGIQIPTQFEK